MTKERERLAESIGRVDVIAVDGGSKCDADQTRQTEGWKERMWAEARQQSIVVASTPMSSAWYGISLLDNKKYFRVIHRNPTANFQPPAVASPPSVRQVFWSPLYLCTRREHSLFQRPLTSGASYNPVDEFSCFTPFVGDGPVIVVS